VLLSKVTRVITSRRKRWAGHVAQMDERRNACRVLVRKPESKTPRGMSKSRWESNVKMGLKGDRLVGRGGIDCG
jgi:hypothetical protein